MKKLLVKKSTECLAAIIDSENAVNAIQFNVRPSNDILNRWTGEAVTAAIAAESSLKSPGAADVINRSLSERKISVFPVFTALPFADRSCIL